MTWISANTGFAFSAISATALTSVMRMEAPTDPTNLTADPPEDIIIQRLRGEFLVTLSATAASAIWVLSLMVVDAVWTPDSTFNAMSDKRILWSQTYAKGTTNAIHNWFPGYMEIASTAFVQSAKAELDISPKVRLEPGKALVLVATELSGTADLTVTGLTMRLLYSRSGRRSRT